MLNAIWVALIVIGVGVSAYEGQVGAVTEAAFAASRQALEMTIGLAGLMALWMGLMKIAERSGLMEALSRLLRPAVRALFPSVPDDHPAVGAILLNVSANMLGLGSAATPMGLRAMQYLQALNSQRTEASEAMCTFLAINTASITLVPGTIIALRAAAGSREPAVIVTATLATSIASGLFAIAADWAARLWYRTRGRSEP